MPPWIQSHYSMLSAADKETDANGEPVIENNNYYVTDGGEEEEEDEGKL